MSDDDDDRRLLLQIGADLRCIKSLLLMGAKAPDLLYPIARFVYFDWHSIGASVLESDCHGPTLVSWAGRVYQRRSPSNKFGEAIWFSRSVGKGEDGSTQYERLITFKSINYSVDPVPEKVARHLVTAS